MNILTFDLEDWFHILGHPETENPEGWSRFEPRLERNVDRLLGILDEAKQSATWFCLGWVVKQYPEIVKKIASLHEIASHSDQHQLVYKQTPDAFRKDTESVIFRLEDLLGKKITTYRASGFSITPETPWAFEILASCGITTDCSVFPARRNHGGFPAFGTAGPCRIRVNGIELRELPLNTYRKRRMNLVFSGGGYFRVLPYKLIRDMTRRSDYVMSYFHPRDFDPEQPMLQSLPVYRRIMSYAGLSKTEDKLKRWLRDFYFTDVQTASRTIQWERTPVITF